MRSLRSSFWNFWYTLSDPETTTAYQLAGSKTWQLLQHFAKFALLVALFLSAIALWLWSVSFQSGRSLRTWLETEQPNPVQLAAGIGQILQSSFKSTSNWIQSKLEAQLGEKLNFLPQPEFQRLEETKSEQKS